MQHSMVRPGKGTGCLSPLQWRCVCHVPPAPDACKGTRAVQTHQLSLPAGLVPGCSLPAPLSPLPSEGHGKKFDNRQRSLKVTDIFLFCHLPKHSVQGKIPSANADASVLRWHVCSWLPCNELCEAPQAGSPR